MKKFLMALAPLGLLALAGCVVAPARGYYPHGYYYAPRAVVVAPAPAIIVRP